MVLPIRVVLPNIAWQKVGLQLKVPVAERTCGREWPNASVDLVPVAFRQSARSAGVDHVASSAGGPGPPRATGGVFPNARIFPARFFFFLLVVLFTFVRSLARCLATTYQNWVRQIQGMGTTDSGYGYDRFRVGYSTPENEASSLEILQGTGT